MGFRKHTRIWILNYFYVGCYADCQGSCHSLPRWHRGIARMALLLPIITSSMFPIFLLLNMS